MTSTPPGSSNDPKEVDMMDESVAELERATALAERYGEALLKVSQLLADRKLTNTGKVMRLRALVASLDTEADHA